MTACSFETLGNVHESCKSCISIGHSYQAHPPSMPCSLLCACPNMLAFCSHSQGTKAAAWTCVCGVCAIKSSSNLQLLPLHIKGMHPTPTSIPHALFLIPYVCYPSCRMLHIEWGGGKGGLRPTMMTRGASNLLSGGQQKFHGRAYDRNFP